MQTNNNPRVALSKILVLAEYLQTRCGVPKFVANEISEIEQAAKAALAEPIRNCEVGTAEEQIERWQAFCNRYDDDCTGCPCEAADTWNYTTCFAKWTQLPYEGGEK